MVWPSELLGIGHADLRGVDQREALARGDPAVVHGQPPGRPGWPPARRRGPARRSTARTTPPWATTSTRWALPALVHGVQALEDPLDDVRVQLEAGRASAVGEVAGPGLVDLVKLWVRPVHSPAARSWKRGSTTTGPAPSTPAITSAVTRARCRSLATTASTGPTAGAAAAAGLSERRQRGVGVALPAALGVPLGLAVAGQQHLGGLGGTGRHPSAAGRRVRVVAVLRLFAAARQAAGTGRIDVPGAANVGDVLDVASRTFGEPFDKVLACARVWCNGQSTTRDAAGWPERRGRRAAPRVRGQPPPGPTDSPAQHQGYQRIADDDYLGDLTVRPIEEVRAMRADCQAVEADLSYLRRLVQGRLDIVAGEARRRESGEAPATVAAIIASSAQ